VRCVLSQARRGSPVTKRRSNNKTSYCGDGRDAIYREWHRRVMRHVRRRSADDKWRRSLDGVTRPQDMNTNHFARPFVKINIRGRVCGGHTCDKTFYMRPAFYEAILGIAPCLAGCLSVRPSIYLSSRTIQLWGEKVKVQGQASDNKRTTTSQLKT